MRAHGTAPVIAVTGDGYIDRGNEPSIAPIAVACDRAANYGIPVFWCDSNKRPLTPHGFKDATLDLDLIEASYRSDALLAWPTGDASGIFVVDIDPAGEDWYRERYEFLACERIHRTRRGWHLLYRVPVGCDIRNSASKVAPGVDVRGTGGYIIDWSAHGYDAVGDMDDIVEPPVWLLELLSTSPSSASKNTGNSSVTTLAPIGTKVGIPEKRRNEYLSREAFRLRKQGRTVEQVGEALQALNRAVCDPPLEDVEVEQIARGKAKVEAQSVTLDDFHAYMPAHQYLFVPTRELWPSSSVNARIPPVQIAPDKTIAASTWLDQHQPVEQMTWAPGESMLIEHRVISGGGWITRQGSTCFNLYRAPEPIDGDPNKAARWVEHVRYVFGSEAEHIIRWLAHRVQRPGEKINHALVLGGAQGIGKDTLLEPVKAAVGAWNFVEVSPAHMLGRFNGFVKSVILRVSEARDLGDVDRFAFYDHLKTYTAAPPDVLRCDEKHLREHAVVNVCGVIITTNHKSDGIYLPADDRRHFVAWSERTKGDFSEQYWNDLWRWYSDGGLQHVCAYLAALDLTAFNPKAPPPKTPAFFEIVDSNRAPEDSELADVIDVLGNPDALSIGQIVSKTVSDDFREWLMDRRNRRKIPHRLESAGYVPVRNDGAADGLWKLDGRRTAVYGKQSLSLRDRIEATQHLSPR